MTASEVAATDAHASKHGRRRRLAWITAALVVPILALLLWPGRSAAYATPLGLDVADAAVAQAVVPNESPAPGIRHEQVASRAPVQRTGLCAWHVEFCKYRGSFVQVGVPFLVLGAIALPGWLLFRLYRRRRTGRPLSFGREILLLAAVVYLLGLAAITLTPNRNSRLRADATAGVDLRPNVASLTCSSASVSGAPNARAFCMQNAAGNVALFFPLGLLIPLVWRRLRFWHGVQIALALSIGIELVQYLSRAWGSYRSADVNDVILNGLGACLGLAVAYLLRLRQDVRPAVSRA